MALKPKIVLHFPAFAVVNDKEGYDFFVLDIQELVIRTEKMDLAESLTYASAILEYHVDKKWRKLKRPVPPTLDSIAQKQQTVPNSFFVSLRVNVMQHVKASEFEPITIMMPKWWPLTKDLNVNALRGIIYGDYHFNDA